MSALGDGLAQLDNLQQVSLDVSDCEELQGGEAGLEPHDDVVGLWHILDSKRTSQLASGKAGMEILVISGPEFASELGLGRWERPILGPKGEILAPERMQVRMDFDGESFEGEMVNSYFDKETETQQYNVYFPEDKSTVPYDWEEFGELD